MIVMNVQKLGVTMVFNCIDHCGVKLQLMMLLELDLVNALLAVNLPTGCCGDSTAFFTTSVAPFSTRTCHDVIVAVSIVLCVIFVCLL